MTTATAPNRTGRVLRERLVNELTGVPVVWALLLIGTLVLVGGVDLFGSQSIEVSGWEQATQIARWYAGGVGVYATAVHLPRYIAHGFTRREFASQLPLFLGAFAVVFAVFMTLGYAVETLAYDLFGWEQGLINDHLYTAATHYVAGFVEFLVVGAVWAVAGTVLGGAFYRNPALGMALVPVGLVMVGLVEIAAGPAYLGPISAARGLPVIGSLFQEVSTPFVTGLTAAVATVGLALMWLLVRDLPVRTRNG